MTLGGDMNQDDLVKLVIFAIVSSSFMAAFLTVLVNNIFIGLREREKSRREIIDNRIRPAEDYLFNLQSLFKKVIMVACDDTLPKNLKDDFEQQFFEFGTRIAIIQSLKILNDNSVNVFIDEFPLMIQNFVVNIFKVIDSNTKENEENVIFEREGLQTKISAIFSLIDAYRINGYRSSINGRKTNEI
jgi:hypothetical protein